MDHFIHHSAAAWSGQEDSKEQHFTTIKQLILYAIVSQFALKPTLASVWGFLLRLILSVYTAALFKVFKGCFPDPSSLEVIE